MLLNESAESESVASAATRVTLQKVAWKQAKSADLATRPVLPVRRRLLADDCASHDALNSPNPPVPPALNKVNVAIRTNKCETDVALKFSDTPLPYDGKSSWDAHWASEKDHKERQMRWWSDGSDSLNSSMGSCRTRIDENYRDLSCHSKLGKKSVSLVTDYQRSRWCSHLLFVWCGFPLIVLLIFLAQALILLSFWQSIPDIYAS